MTKDKSLYPLVALQGFAALMVFTFHASGPVKIGSPDLWFPGVAFLAKIMNDGVAWVSFFFVASGFTMAFAYQERISKGATSAMDYAVARASKIVPLAWVTTTVAAILYWICWYKFGNNWFDLTRWLGDYFFLNGDFLTATNNAMNQPLWYITPQIFAYAAFFAVLRTKSEYKFWGGGIPYGDILPQCLSRCLFAA